MALTETQALTVLDETIADLKLRPVDLLNRNDQEGEREYLDNAYLSYKRTLLDVVDGCNKIGPGSGPVRILEVGTFLGVVSLSLAKLGFKVSALDIPEFAANERLLELFHSAGIELNGVNLRDYILPYADDSFDLVIMCETLEHLNFNPLPVMTEINRVLDGSGQLYLALPNLASLPQRYNLLTGRSIHNPITDFVGQLSDQGNMIVGLHWREYTRSEVLEMLSLTGFRCCRHRYEMPGQAGRVARVLYYLFPSLRPAQSVLASKVAAAGLQFHFSDASRAC